MTHANEPADVDTKAFISVRPRLFGLAYRMLGSVAEAEDVVQDAWVRWQGADRESVRDSTAFLVTTTTRLAINATQSARVRRETYLGPWLPEPVQTDADPALGAERAEAMDLAVLLLLERLSPTERAAYVLREAFDYPYQRIAEVLGLGEANSRQLVSRARKHLRAERRAQVDPTERRRLLEALVAAARTGDLAGLERVLAADVVATADGGGVVSAARLPVAGRDRVATFLTRTWAKHWTSATIRFVETNGNPSLLVSDADQPIVLVSFDVTTDGVHRIQLVLNPAKLTAFGG